MSTPTPAHRAISRSSCWMAGILQILQVVTQGKQIIPQLAISGIIYSFIFLRGECPETQL